MKKKRYASTLESPVYLPKGRFIDHCDANQEASTRTLEAEATGRLDPRLGTPGQFRAGTRLFVMQESLRTLSKCIPRNYVPARGTEQPSPYQDIAMHDEFQHIQALLARLLTDLERAAVIRAVERADGCGKPLSHTERTRLLRARKKLRRFR